MAMVTLTVQHLGSSPGFNAGQSLDLNDSVMAAFSVLCSASHVTPSVETNKLKTRVSRLRTYMSSS